MVFAPRPQITSVEELCLILLGFVGAEQCDHSHAVKSLL